jgi:hypothetical protein
MSDLLPAWRTWLARTKHRALALSTLALLAGHAGSAQAEPIACASQNPADWPPPAKPFFLIAFDTSGSMVQCINPPTTFPNSCAGGAVPNSCGLPPSRINDGKCALRKMVQAFGEVDFGLMSFPSNNTCTGAAAACPPYNLTGTYPFKAGPGNRCSMALPAGASAATGCLPGADTAAQGGKLLVGLPVAANQAQQIIDYTDDVCNTGDPIELLPAGGTPINGQLRDAAKYLRTPAALAALAPSCRPINVILITDGEESCDGTSATNKAKLAARDLYDNGIGNGDGRHVKVFPIGFSSLPPAAVAALDDIAKEGQCDSADAQCKLAAKGLVAANEAELSIQLSKIISGAIAPETCDNVDNNCNGCTDEGFRHYCNRGRVEVGSPTASGQCCSWSNKALHDKCVTAYKLSISASKPQGDLFKLPCWDPDGAAQPLTPEESWVCADPGEVCDDKDNNCETSTIAGEAAKNTVDEGFKKCGSPLACPKAETCIPGTTQGKDDDCDGVVDNAAGSSVPGSACSGVCQFPSPEICDGLDNDCNGQVDDNVPVVVCGPAPGPGTPPNCQGTIACVNGTYSGACSLNPQPEICDLLDNDCNGKVDDGAPGTPCEIPGKPGLKYQEDGFPNSQCKKGVLPCNAPATACGGYVGPSEEVCDGIDNDCDGKVDADDMDFPIPGVGAQCNNLPGECKPGIYACIGGTFACEGGTKPQMELCNGLDDDCDGIDDANESGFADAPAPGMEGCWTGIAMCDAADQCSFTTAAGTVSWCKPPGSECGGVGTLSSPCTAGTLVCSGGVQGYKCVGGTLPIPEKCDGIDNNCDGMVDSPLPSVGMDCNLPDPNDPTKDWPAGSPCKKGKQLCFNGSVSCVDAQGNPTVTPQPETCDAIDNDCNGKVDDMVPSDGSPCEPDYDKTKFPGMRFFTGQCKLGIGQCDPSGNGKLICMGAIGPTAEVCDGIDNDCDQKVDETDAQTPDGLLGSPDPADMTHVIGEACGVDKGECKPGKWGCSVGSVVCSGGVLPQPEVCDCKDNNCDGQVDEDVMVDGGAIDPICGQPTMGVTQKCVSFEGLCQCASNCDPGEFPCPGGNYVCANATKSGGTEAVNNVCVQGVGALCNNCAGQTKTTKDAQGKDITVCAPTSPPGGSAVPVCVCKGADGCANPCKGVKCDAPLVCTDFGEAAGKCVDNNCFTIPCGAGKLCTDLGQCEVNPCTPTSCKADEVCKPSDDLKSKTCVKSCAGVMCKDTETCHDGVCKATGCPAAGCGTGKVCSPDATKGCIDSPCKNCPTGQSCDLVTGKCGASPCEGVLCPSGQICKDGECETGAAGSAGSAGAAGSAGSAGGGQGLGGSQGVGGQAGSANSQGGTGTGATTGAGGATGGGVVPATTPVGLTTGGGGCSCEAAGHGVNEKAGLFGLLIAAIPALRRRRARPTVGDRSQAKGGAR